MRNASVISISTSFRLQTETWHSPYVLLAVQIHISVPALTIAISKVNKTRGSSLCRRCTSRRCFSEPCCVLKEMAHAQAERRAYLLQAHGSYFITSLHGKLSFLLCIGKDSIYYFLLYYYTYVLHVSEQLKVKWSRFILSTLNGIRSISCNSRKERPNSGIDEGETLSLSITKVQSRQHCIWGRRGGKRQLRMFVRQTAGV